MREERIIFHIDVNSAFLSWENCYRMQILGEERDIRNIPSAIGGDIEKRKGVILAKSISAKKCGIKTGEPIVSALAKCPELLVLQPHFDVYVRYSRAFINILKEYTPLVEQYSIDEAFMDMTGTQGLHGDLIETAYKIKERIYDELGFTVNIGVSTNKLLAKMASDFEKPNKVHTLFKSEIAKKMWPLPVGELFFVGKVAEKKLNLLGIKSIGDLAKADIKLLKVHLNKHGEVIYKYANGIDESKVINERPNNKGYSNEMTIPVDVDSVENAHLVLLSLCETVAARLRSDKKEAACISVSIVNTYFESSSKQMSLNTPTNLTTEIYEIAFRLFNELWNHKTPIRQLGVSSSCLYDEDVHQFNLFEPKEHKKYVKLDKAIDSIRDKFGDAAIKRASFIGQDISHMAGEISKEKRI